MVLDTTCSNLLSPFDLVQKCQFCAFNESTDNSQVDKVISAVLHALCSDSCWRHTPIDALLQFKMNEIYLGMKSVKLLLVLSIYLH